MESLTWNTSYFKGFDTKDGTSKLKINSSDESKFLDLFVKVESENQINEIEKEFKESLNLIEELYNREDIDDYLKNKNSKVLLKEELEIIKLLSKYTLQNNYIDYEFFIKSVKLIYKITEILRCRIKQEEIIHKTKNFNTYIPRCSYKFCNYKDNCIFNYNTKNKNVCYQDHYVHNMVAADLVILEDYINFKFEDKKIIVPNKEILKTINTLSFVIDHMQTELNSKCLYLNDDECEKMHFIKKTK
jgi:hypothetical protein